MGVVATPTNLFCFPRQPLAVDYVIGYKSLIHFLEHETTPLKQEIKQSVAYPLFIYCYLALVAMDESDKGDWSVMIEAPF